MKVSIVTVCLNAVQTIQHAVDSVAAQDYPDIEHIIIDGASTDGTLDLLKNINRRISRMISEKDDGLYDAMNKGAGLSTGEVIGFLNADDIYASDRVISKVVECFKESSIDACYGDLEYVARDDIRKTVRRWKSGEFHKGSFAKGWVPPHPSFFVRHKDFRRVGGFNTSLKFAADNDLMMRLLESDGISAAYIPEVLVKMRTGGATNKSLSNIFRGNLEILQALRANKIPHNVISYVLNKGMKRAMQFFHPGSASLRT